MAEKKTGKIIGDQSFDYHIQIRGHLDVKWAEWFGHAEIQWIDKCKTLIICRNIDQAELFRLLKKVRNLGLLLISVQLIFPEHEPLVEREDCKKKEENN